MKFSATFAAVFLAISVSARPVKRDVDPALIPEFGFQSGLNPTGTGDCDGAVNGANGQPIKIPCKCPPARDEFIRQVNANVAAGFAVNNPSVRVSFPTDNSKESQLARMQTALVTLQNLEGPGRGCPAASTTFLAQQRAIQDGTAPPPPAAPQPQPQQPSPAPSNPAPGNDVVDPALIPEFGFQSGLNPTGTGDCDGAVNGADGRPIKIPCKCPPARDEFIRQVNANVAAGFAVNNPSVRVSFPTDNSKESQLARMQTALVTLQNLEGPGRGCPAASTTFLAQQRAIQDGTAPPPPVAPAPQPAPEPAPAPAPAPAPEPAPAPAPGNNVVNPALIPEFGFQSGLNPTGTGDCDGAVNGADGRPIKIPCKCPPSRDEFIRQVNANVAAGFAVNNPSVRVSFPTDNSRESQLARMHTALVTLQNLEGPGRGCPAASTTFLAQQKAIQDGTAPPPAVTPAPAPAPQPAPAPGNNVVDPALVPDLGFQRGLNPTGTGDCDGAVNGADGRPIKIPCACPPDRDEFIQSLTANVAAGFAVNNPSVRVTFPTDDSNASKAARIQASLVTLQNLQGPGRGCPAASTTLLAQLREVQ